MLKQFVFAAATCVFALSAQAAEPAMMNKHKLECAACHVDGVGKPVPTKQCQSCHPADKFEKNCRFTTIRHFSTVRSATASTRSR